MKKILRGISHFIRKHKVFTIIIALVIIGLIVLTVFLLNRNTASSAPTGMFTQNTMSLTKMDLTKSVSATGTIESANTKTVSANIQNVSVESVKVAEGDEVTKGDTLVTFNEEDLQDSLSDAKETLSDTKDQIARDLESAQEKVDDAQDTYTTQKKTMATKVAEAKSSYQSLKKKLASATGAEKTSLTQQVNEAKQSYDNAVSEQESTNKQNKSSLSQAEDNLITTKNNNKKSLKEAQKSVDDAESSLKECSVTAPMSGTVTAVGVSEGDTYSGGDMFEISDCSDLQVSATVDEYDIADVTKGLRVVMLTDATDDDELEGEITFVSPTTGTSSLSSSSSSSSQAGASTSMSSSSSSSSGSYTIRIKVKITDERLRVGMTAKCSIILDEVSDVYAVPYDAIHTNSNGDSVIYVTSTDNTASAATQGGMQGQRPSTNSISQKEVVATKGMESEYYVEISGSDLSEGLTVIIPTDSTDSSSSDSSDSSSGALDGLMGGASSGNRGDMGGGGMGGGPMGGQ